MRMCVREREEQTEETDREGSSRKRESLTSRRGLAPARASRAPVSRAILPHLFAAAACPEKFNQTIGLPYPMQLQLFTSSARC